MKFSGNSKSDSFVREGKLGDKGNSKAGQGLPGWGEQSRSGDNNQGQTTVQMARRVHSDGLAHFGSLKYCNALLKADC